MKVLIFGANGQDANILEMYYKELGYEVLMVSRYELTGRLKSDYSVPSLTKIMKETSPELIYFTAAQSSVSKSWRDKGETINANVGILVNFFEAYHRSNSVGLVAWFNSSEIYGESKNRIPHTEESPRMPSSPYALSKCLCSDVANYYSNRYSIPVAEFVLFNHESEYRNGMYFVNKVISSLQDIVEGKSDYVRLGNLNIYRDFGSAKNYMKIIMELMEAGFTGRVNICSGKAIELKSIVQKVCEMHDLKYEEVIKIDESFYRTNDAEFILGSNEFLKTLTSKTPVIENFDVILEELVVKERSKRLADEKC